MEAIRKLISEMNHTVKKTDVVEKFNKSVLTLNNEVLPMIEELETFIKTNNLSMSDLKELGTINKVSGIKAKDIVGFVNGIEYILKDLNGKSSEFTNLIDKQFPDLISRDAMTIKEATILNVINNFTNVVLFTSDLVLFVIDVLNVKINKDNTALVRSKIMEIKSSSLKYAEILAFFLESKNIIKELEKASNDKLLVDAKDSGAISMLKPGASKIKLVGFIGNPIYHVKMWLVDMQVARYEALKEKKKLTELKILELKAKQNGEPDAKLEKAIEYHENKLEGMEYQIRKAEEG